MSAGTPNWKRVHELGKLPKEHRDKVLGAEEVAEREAIESELARYKERFGDLPVEESEEKVEESSIEEEQAPVDEIDESKNVSIFSTDTRKKMEQFCLDLGIMSEEQLKQFKNKSDLFAAIQEMTAAIAEK